MKLNCREADIALQYITAYSHCGFTIDIYICTFYDLT